MVQRAQLVEDTMTKVEGMRGKEIAKLRPIDENNVGNGKKIKVEETTIVEYCKFCNKLGHQADKCWKKAEACLRCGSHDHRIPNCPMLKDQAGRNQGVVKRPGHVNALTRAELLEEGMVKDGHTPLNKPPLSHGTTPRVAEVVLEGFGGWETQGGRFEKKQLVLFSICDLHLSPFKIITKGEQDIDDIENQEYTGDE
ncbi:hypothetical protein Taro_025255 [Colocasia esculenta]|uniref:CCHC-type domain-containing protein n=1 Tax=Colocasia esculenta TaxID=4460 RepID=A0A843VDP8_COLES|nr:hypothetical protein [Colocasia esculenta]